MENKNYIPTAPLYDCADNHGTQLNLPSSQIPRTNDARHQESELGDYSHIARSAPSSQQLPVSNQKLSRESAQLYDAPYEVLQDRKSNDAQSTRVPTVSPQLPQSPRCQTSGKVLLITILVLILLLLVSILAMLFYLASKVSCNCTIASNYTGAGAGLTNGNCTAENNVTLLQSKMDYILEQNINNSLLLQDKMNSVLSEIGGHANITKMSAETILQLLNTTGINDVQQTVDELLELQHGVSFFHPILCRSIKELRPNSPTGYYYINSRKIYCIMDQLCGQEGGWTRIAYLDMSDRAQNCPYGLQTQWISGLRTCGLPYNNRDGACRSVKFLTGESYTQICGRVLGYQRDTTDGIRSNTSIDSPYLDGVSITRGSPRQHVWSYIAGLNSSEAASCPCSNDNANANVPIAGNNYYCESGSSDEPHDESQLWDGACSDVESACCSSKLSDIPLPWFYRGYGNATSTDYLELRICCDEGTNDENVLVQLYEIYVK
uniref:Fibrinogen C-terminal domain-containing protein n=1 Tax=Amphimedon queenslandica TaxID=400682 RepID=A0A1X7VIJ3_AMPQE